MRVLIERNSLSVDDYIYIYIVLILVSQTAFGTFLLLSAQLFWLQAKHGEVQQILIVSDENHYPVCAASAIVFIVLDDIGFLLSELRKG